MAVENGFDKPYGYWTPYGDVCLVSTIQSQDGILVTLIIRAKII